MSLSRKCKLFGSVRRTEVLELLALLGESFPAEVARLLKARPYSIQQILDSLEEEGVTVSRKLGLERRVTLNPRYPAHEELRAVLLKLGRNNRDLVRALARRRRRPRRKGKPL